MDRPFCAPRPPIASAANRNIRHPELAFAPIIVVINGIRHHGEILGQVDASDKDRFDVVAMSYIASECDPRVIVTFRICLEGGF